MIHLLTIKNWMEKVKRINKRLSYRNLLYIQRDSTNNFRVWKSRVSPTTGRRARVHNCLIVCTRVLHKRWENAMRSSIVRGDDSAL